MKTLIDFGRTVEETKATYFCASREDGNVKKTGSDGLPRFATAIQSHQVPESQAPISAD